MDIGKRISDERCRCGLDIDAVSKALSVDSSVVSKWESGELVPSVKSLVGLAKVFNTTVDALCGAINPENIVEFSDDSSDKVDWTNVWGAKYPILIRYKKEVEVSKYEESLNKLMNQLQSDYGYSELDAMLVLKDILYCSWKKRKGR